MPFPNPGAGRVSERPAMPEDKALAPRLGEGINGSCPARGREQHHAAGADIKGTCPLKGESSPKATLAAGVGMSGRPPEPDVGPRRSRRS